MSMTIPPAAEVNSDKNNHLGPVDMIAQPPESALRCRLMFLVRNEAYIYIHRQCD
jgi:hypothetical protein